MTTTLTRITTKHIASAALATLAVIITLGAISMTVAAISYRQSYQGRMFPGVRVLDISVGGLTKAEANETLSKALENKIPDNLAFTAVDQGNVIANGQIALKNPDIIRFDIAQTVDQAYAVGRGNTPLQDFLTQMQLRRGTKEVSLKQVEVDANALRSKLQAALTSYDTEPKDASLAIAMSATSSHIQTVITPETTGTRFDLTNLDKKLAEQAKNLTFTALSIPTVVVQPRVTSNDILPLLDNLDQKIGLKPLKVTAERREWTIDPKTYIAWYDVTSTNGTFALIPDADRLKKDVEPLVQSFLKEAKDGSFSVETNASGTKRLKEFTAPVEGVALDAAAMRDALIERSNQPTTTALAIPLAKISPSILGADAAEMGIKEALGTGYSNFSGSPSNRRKNIKLGEQKTHGTLVAPGQEFSMLSVLGEIDGKHGWLPELVIKGNKTTPEYGGGLCQIGTTAFRAALDAGMPITERQNHSYRVRYYEPAGTDATIYDPAPDFKFKNDTEHWILITGEIAGDDVSFTIWGTSDGRVGKYEKPRVFNIVQPPPTKYVETTEIPVGTTKCTESAHAGADAVLEYFVTMANGEVRKQVFTSKYRPWQAVCLKGVAAVTTPAEGIDETGINNPN